MTSRRIPTKLDRVLAKRFTRGAPTSFALDQIRGFAPRSPHYCYYYYYYHYKKVVTLFYHFLYLAIVGIFRDDEENIVGSFVCFGMVIVQSLSVFCILSSFDDRMQVRNTKKQTKMALIIPKSEKILI